MLGRRLLLLVAVLLITGAIAAALTPRELRNSSPSTTATTPAPSATSGTGGTPAGAMEITRTIDAQSSRQAIVQAKVGDLLHLAVKVTSPDEVEIVGTGRFDSADADTPARFDFFLDSAGTFPVRLQEGGRDVGRLIVSPR